MIAVIEAPKGSTGSTPAHHVRTLLHIERHTASLPSLNYARSPALRVRARLSIYRAFVGDISAAVSDRTAAPR
ncbi:hypothetical protein GCM10011487_43090 [Steroidobacter agaridevorans]|uniref:Uncharacterized protein n=2 Tax=Steroidobacter agaridevorans TaxID=2695856 RepID=A0A829YGC2_9GAMM|nr:hypothetical protein [Steroidobacter agaridevorans]GFE82309.1 hypothetical protein GCM10011487_43090 [Steroidobacter agaridevorans]GFE85303.1 hypothetical protein GCM10011488_02570 [Steroidobacter agaridevorans]